MKTAYLRNIACIILLALVAAGCSQKSSDPIVDAELNQLLNAKQYFKLRDKLAKSEDKLSSDRFMYYQAHVNHVFDRCEQSNANIETLLEKYSDRLNDTLKGELLLLNAANSTRLYRYKDAAKAYATILEQYRHVLDEDDVESYQNVQMLWATLSNVPPQQIHKPADIELAGYHNQFNHHMIPVRAGSEATDFIFDTGANLSTITVSSAEKMGMTLYDVDITAKAATDVSVKSMLAVADSIFISKLLVENVVFLVVPDEQLSFPSIGYEIKGIIGFPVFHQMGEVRMRNDGTILIPKDPVNKSLGNLYVENLHPAVQVLSGSDTLIFTLDTGAKSTDLTKLYYDKHKSAVESNGELITSMQGSAGGFIEKEVYLLKDFPFTIGSKSGNISEVCVNLEDRVFNSMQDGNLGQDVLAQFSELVLSFTYMYVDFNEL